MDGSISSAFGVRGAGRPLRALFSLLAIIALSGCCWLNPFASSREPDVRAVFVAAVEDPQAFDGRLSSLTVPDGAPDCLRELMAVAFELEQEQLLECGQLITGSPAWNECHERAENMHNHGVILGDIARAIEGNQSFSSSSGGSFLILTQSALGPALYDGVVGQLTSLIPDMKCDLGCE